MGFGSLNGLIEFGLKIHGPEVKGWPLCLLSLALSSRKARAVHVLKFSVG